MAKFLLNNVFRIAISTLNFVSPSIIADILLHPFDFATVLLQIGYAPEGCKYETATLVSIIVQYALFTFYIPYLLTSVQGLQFMGMSSPSIFNYINYIYNKEGFKGCYRGLLPKICERILMLSVSEKIRRGIDKVTEPEGMSDIENGMFREIFLQNLVIGLCSQFFAVLVSHPFHVLMVTSFAEFTSNKKSSVLELTYSIYKKNGYFGFFTGLAARLLGELFSLIFSVTYTTIINKQVRPQQTVAEIPLTDSYQKTANLLNYVTDLSRFTAFKTERVGRYYPGHPKEKDVRANIRKVPRRFYECYTFLLSILRNITQNSTDRRVRNRNFSFLAFVPVTSKLFYYVVIRDFLSKKISSPFLQVCHCAIVLGTGWDKCPFFRLFWKIS